MAKVYKQKIVSKGIVYDYWCVDPRSIGLNRITKNPNTNERFESKKEAQAFLDDLTTKRQSGLSIDANKLEIRELCLPGEFVVIEGSNSGHRMFDDKGGEYISARYRHLDREKISLNHFQSMRRSLQLLIDYSDKYNIKYWTTLDAERVLDSILALCKKNANKKETPELKEASAWTSFEKHLKNLKCMSTWVSQEKKCEDVFGNIITSKKHGRDLTYEKPARLINLQKKSKDKTVDVARVNQLRDYLEYSYQKQNLKLKPDYANSRRRTMLLQYDLLKAIGLRIGEAIALTWDDIQGDEIRINKQFNSKSYTVTETKGGVYEHFITIDDALAKRFQEHKELQSDIDKKNNLVFPNTKGEYDTRRVLGRIMKQGCKRLWGNEISLHITPHTLRHLFATEMIRKGGKDVLPLVSEILRHSTGVKFTEKQYVHETKKSEKQRLKQKEAVTDLYA